MSARTILKHVYENGGMTEYQYERIDRVLKERERPHGAWLTAPYSMIMHCSKCGAEENRNKLHSAKWCYSCGADMREGEENEID